jgi:type III secretion protein V
MASASRSRGERLGPPRARPPGLAPLPLSGDVRAFLTRHSDLALAALVVSIVAMMIIPLPAFLLDLLISLNIAAAVTLLLISIYVSDALKIATFPTLLLLTTLFRLALEVSATRLILLHANAGQVIHAFGSVVVAGNLVVGAVVFLILTLIQFIVISKGSERVAEVAARFTLDAMPGKQLSIDAELRGGHIDAGEARRRRAALARESQLFGAMDGAMKFVKGDAIAGVVVLVVNIVGGLIIGVLQRGMDLAAAARTYTLLTIGEGLVAQIPALVISTAAGIIVTRVASEDEGGPLGREIGAQILGQPKAIAVAAGLLALLALVAGLPLAPFLALAAALGGVAWRLGGRRRPGQRRAGSNGGVATGPTTARSGSAATAPDTVTRGRRTPAFSPVVIDLSAELSALLRGADQVGTSEGGDSDSDDSDDDGRNDGNDRGGDDRGDDRLAWELASAVAARLFAETGIPLPALRVRSPAPELAGRSYVLRLNEVPLGHGETPPDARQAQDQIAGELLRLMRRYGHELIGIEETQSLLDGLRRSDPALVREVVPKVVSPALLTEVLRRLAAEGISLRNLREVLSALATWAPTERDPAALAEHARAARRRAITFQHAGDGPLGALLLDPMIEETLRESIHKTATGCYLALDPQISSDILAAIAGALRALPDAVAAAARTPAGRMTARPVILTTADIRRHVRHLVAHHHPDLAVLSHQDLAPEAQVQTLGRVTV